MGARLDSLRQRVTVLEQDFDGIELVESTSSAADQADDEQEALRTPLPDVEAPRLHREIGGADPGGLRAQRELHWRGVEACSQSSF